MRQGGEEGEAMSEWQPIESAPRDGTWIVLTDGTSVSTGYWGGTCFGGGPMAWLVYGHRSDYEEVDLDGTPTHWQPLPAPPDPTGGKR